MQNLKISSERINPQAIEVCKVLSQVGYQAFIVGGCVRDLLLNQQPKDWDITTDAPAAEVMKIFNKTIPTGLQHGTVTVVMGEGKENHFEVTTFRIEGNYVDGRRPEEVFFVQNVEQDLARRDLTINAIAYDPITHYLIDPFDGVNDLKRGIIRAVGNPLTRFKEDGLRIMRAARFAARFGYELETETFQAMRSTVSMLRLISKERIQDELCKILMSAYPSQGLQWLLYCGAIPIVFPALDKSVITADLLGYLDSISTTPAHLETRVATLYKDVPANQVLEELTVLKFSNKQIKRVCFLINLLEKYYIFASKDTALAYKSFMAVIKNHAPDHWTDTLEQFILFSEAIKIASRVQLNKFQSEVVFSKQEMQINGYDLLGVGFPQNAKIKQVLDDCYLEILRNPENNSKEFLLQLAQSKRSV